MATTASKTSQSKWPAVILVVVTLLLLFVVIRMWDRAPRTDDAYVYADTIDVVPEVNGRIVELAVHDNQAVKQGDLLFRIDPRPYQDALARGNASLVALDRQIELTQRSVNAQQYNAQSVRAAVGRARAAASQASDTLTRMEPLLSHGYVAADEVDRARTAQRATQAELSAAQLQAQQAQAAVSGVDALVAQRAVVMEDINGAVRVGAQTRLHVDRHTSLVCGRELSRDGTQGRPYGHPRHGLSDERYGPAFPGRRRFDQLWRRAR
jgi:multidrug efflux system membrane fusion protein